MIFKTDWAFSIINVVSHGIPYFALIYVYNLKNNKDLIIKNIAPFFLVILLLLLGFFEEGIWNAFIWKEEKSFFKIFSFIPPVKSAALEVLLIPLLALPQATHYFLDGLIWKKDFS